MDAAAAAPAHGGVNQGVPPVTYGTGDRPPRHPQKALLQQGIKGRVLGKPLARPALHEPELQNLRGLFPVAFHQTRDCTLATLSSRV